MPNPWGTWAQANPRTGPRTPGPWQPSSRLGVHLPPHLSLRDNSREAWFKSQLLLCQLYHPSHLAALCLSFLVCKVGIRLVSPLPPGSLRRLSSFICIKCLEWALAQVNIYMSSKSEKIRTKNEVSSQTRPIAQMNRAGLCPYGMPGAGLGVEKPSRLPPTSPSSRCPVDRRLGRMAKWNESTQSRGPRFRSPPAGLKLVASLL